MSDLSEDITRKKLLVLLYEDEEAAEQSAADNFTVFDCASIRIERQEQTIQQLTDENKALMEIIDMVYGCLSNPEFHHIFAKTNYTALMELMQAAEGVPVAKQGDSDERD